MLQELLDQHGLREILEWTFLYDETSVRDNTPYNTTFFEAIGGVSYHEWRSGIITPEELMSRVEGKIHEWQDTLTSTKESLTRAGHPWIEIEGIDSMLLSLQMAERAIPIELEKASVTLLISDEERMNRVKAIEQNQTLLYGERVSYSYEESLGTLTRIREKFHAGSHFLSEGEKREFEDIYETLGMKLSALHENVLFPGIHEYTEHSFSRDPLTTNILEKYGRMRISRHQYLPLFQEYIDLLSLPQRVRENRNVTSIYDGELFLEVPVSQEYDTLSLENIVCLMIHEIGTHYVNQQISARNHLVVRGKGNIEKEEGLAIIMEMLLLGMRFESMKDVGGSYQYMLASELLSWNERRAFMKYMIRLQNIPEQDSLMARDLRVMRGFPFAGGACARKDCSYTRGKEKILSAIAQGQCTLRDMYRGKVGIDDILSPKIGSVIGENTIILPFLLPDLILFMLITHDLLPTQEVFRDFIFSKYGHAFDINDLTYMSDLSLMTHEAWQAIRALVERIISIHSGKTQK